MIETGIRRVLVAIKDPDPRVNGGDLRRFCAAVIEGVLDLGAGAAATYAGLLHRLNSGGPRLIRACWGRTLGGGWSRPGQWCNSVEQAASERAIIAP
jgi:hypothetical protein